MSKPSLVKCQPIKLHHPTSPATGWSATILDAEGYPFVRVYGRTEDHVRARSDKVFEVIKALDGELK
jgi:hypothetical protein